MPEKIENFEPYESEVPMYHYLQMWQASLVAKQALGGLALQLFEITTTCEKFNSISQTKTSSVNKIRDSKFYLITKVF